MKKRIFAFLACFMVLFASFTVFVGAEEVSEPTEQQNHEYALTNVVDTTDFKYPAYSVTIKDGDTIDWLFGESYNQLTANANSIIVAHNGRWSSGKYLGDVTVNNYYLANDYGYLESVSVTQAPDLSGSPKHVLFSFGSDDYGFLVKCDNGVVVDIQGIGKGLKGASFKQIDVLYSIYGGEDYSVDSLSQVESIVDFLIDDGVNVQYVKGLTANGLIGLMFENFGTAITGFAGGMRNTVTKLIYANGVNGELSVLVKFIFLIAGISIAMTVFYLIFRLIRFGRQR